MPSFDIVSKIEFPEIDNAIDGVTREIAQRYDFKGSHCSVERNELELTIKADDDLKLKQMHELIQGHLARRKIENGVLDYKEVEKAAGQSVRQKVLLREGIEKDVAKQIVKDLKGSGIKVQVAIQGDELRVSGKKRDDLQEAIAFVKGLPIEQPLQFNNFRD
ncbi:MAG: YajQ family cyclic di-GMP-binding protein [Rhizobiales bacterium]|nr:YajQ family cyclic di-GMP-binding protein [Hyphomicrobiales bacterium]